MPATAAGSPTEFLDQKVVTAHFFATQVLPQAAGLLPAVTAGPADLFAATFDRRRPFDRPDRAGQNTSS